MRLLNATELYTWQIHVKFVNILWICVFLYQYQGDSYTCRFNKHVKRMTSITVIRWMAFSEQREARPSKGRGRLPRQPIDRFRLRTILIQTRLAPPYIIFRAQTPPERLLFVCVSWELERTSASAAGGYGLASSTRMTLKPPGRRCAVIVSCPLGEAGLDNINYTITRI